MEMCCLVTNYLMQKSHIHIGVISTQIKQESVSIPNTQHSFAAVTHMPRARKIIQYWKICKVFKNKNLVLKRNLLIYTRCFKWNTALQKKMNAVQGFNAFWGVTRVWESQKPPNHLLHLLELLQQELEKIGIVEWFGLEETFRDHLVQPLCYSRDIIRQVRFLKIISNMTLNTSSEGHPQLLWANLCQCLTTLIIKKHPPHVQSKPTLFQFNSITPCAITPGPYKKSLSCS